MEKPELVRIKATGSFRGHGFSPRSDANQPVGQSVPTGKFGRMFPELPIFAPDPDGLRELGAAMKDAKPNDEQGDNAAIPAGYTYLGQFIDHDITLDTSSLQEILVDPLALQNFRTPMLDLDSLYGSGPNLQPYLYEYVPQKKGKGPQQDLFLIGKTNEKPSSDKLGNVYKTGLENDIPRASSTLGIIGDPRNDENLIVSQLHLAFLKFHNKVVAGLKDGTIPRVSIDRSVFEDARQLIIWHYQWIVVHDFLGRLLDPKQLGDVITNGPQFYKIAAGQYPFMPVEYSAAAYRFGHSMVREEYDYNKVFTFRKTPERLTTATLGLLFAFTAKSGDPADDFPVPIPTNWIIDWNRFFEINPAVPFNPSRKLDPFLPPALHSLPNVPVPIELAVRNLIRGRNLGLPSGQNVARFMGFEPLTPAQIATGADGAVAQAHGFDRESPLWYYILKEAEVQGKGARLGQVGSRIIAEVIISLLRADSSSFFVRNRNWKPTLPSAKAGEFTMVDLLKFVGDLNPLEDPGVNLGVPADGPPAPPNP